MYYINTHRIIEKGKRIYTYSDNNNSKNKKRYKEKKSFKDK
jgi:hypothetical protein